MADNKVQKVLAPSSLVTRIEGGIYLLRGHRVMLSHDLAALYEVQTKVLMQAVRRNIKRFPDDFMFPLTGDEVKELRSQFVTLVPGLRTYTPYGIHRTRRCHAVQRSPQRSRDSGKHRNHARLRQVAQHA